jgi:hypothetical protein
MENDAAVMGPTWLLGIQSLLQSKRWNHWCWLLEIELTRKVRLARVLGAISARKKRLFTILRHRCNKMI